MHGLSVPIGKLGYHLPRTLSSAIRSEDVDPPTQLHILKHVRRDQQVVPEQILASTDRSKLDESQQRSLFRTDNVAVRSTNPIETGSGGFVDPEHSAVDFRPSSRTAVENTEKRNPPTVAQNNVIEQETRAIAR